MISFACPICNMKLSAKEELAGNRAKCPNCGGAVTVEAAATVPPRLSLSDDVSLTLFPQRHADATATFKSASSDDNDPNLSNMLAPPQAPDEMGRLGSYRILKVLGRGGMGVVFKGEDPKLDRPVAIKAMLPVLAASASAGKRFIREAQAMAKLTHDHVVRVYQVDEDRGVPYMAMEFLLGEPLDVRLSARGRLPVPDVIRIGREVAEALKAAHTKGLVHRDIKPANIWIEEPNDRIKILDFGLARAASQESGLTQDGAIVGTPSYMAPEQARGETVDARCDLWSLGVVIYRMSTGSLPFAGNDTISTLMAVATQDPIAPKDKNPEIPEGLSHLVMRLLEKDPERRLDSADEVIVQLTALEANDPSAGTSHRAGQGKSWASILKPVGRHRGILIGVSAILALAVGLVIFLNRRPLETDRVKNRNDKVAGATVPPLSSKTRFTNSLGMEFVLIPKGKAWLRGGAQREGDLEYVVERDFFLGVYELTQAEWVKVMGNNPSRFQAGQVGMEGFSKDHLAKLPIDSLTWDDTDVFLNKLNEQDKQAGWEYRLPKELEWEYACRGGPMTDKSQSAFDYYLEKPSNQLLPNQANFNLSGYFRTCKVGTYRPNSLGLYDMHGNVFERVIADLPAQQRFRGGCWMTDIPNCKVTTITTTAHNAPNMLPIFGLRLACVPVNSGSN